MYVLMTQGALNKLESYITHQSDMDWVLEQIPELGESFMVLRRRRSAKNVVGFFLVSFELLSLSDSSWFPADCGILK